MKSHAYQSTITCPFDGLRMPAVPPGNLTSCPHCGSVYRYDEMCELAALEPPKRDPHQDGVRDRQVTRGIGESPLQHLVVVDATQRGVDVPEQMRIGELDDSNCAHSIELYKHAGAHQVMYFTARSMAPPRGEPGRKLPGQIVKPRR